MTYTPPKMTTLDAVSDFRWSKPRQFFTFLAVGVGVAVVGLVWMMNFGG